MMKSRKEIKERAREMRKAHKTVSILYILALAAAISVVGGILGRIPYLGTAIFVPAWGIIGSFITFIMVPKVYMGIYRNEDRDIMQVGEDTFEFVKELITGDKTRSIEIIKKWACTMLLTILWGLVPIVGWIHILLYAAVPYIMLENPELGYKETINKSMEIMKGHRWEMIVLYLSFIGWLLLSVFTFGILDIVFTVPYMQISAAGFILERMEDAGLTKVDKVANEA